MSVNSTDELVDPDIGKTIKIDIFGIIDYQHKTL